MKYRPLSTPQKANVWQLFLLPCVFACFYFLSIRPAFGSIGQLLFQFGSAAALGLAATLPAFALRGGLRASAIGLDLFLLGMVGWAVVDQVQRQTPGEPFTWHYSFFYDRPASVLAAALLAYFFVCLVRLVVPQTYNTVPLQRNFASFFNIAGIGVLGFYACVLFHVFFLARMESSGASLLAPNFIPFKMVGYYFTEMREAPWKAYEELTYLLGNAFLFFPFGFFLQNFEIDHTFL